MFYIIDKNPYPGNNIGNFRIFYMKYIFLNVLLYNYTRNIYISKKYKYYIF